MIRNSARIPSSSWGGGKFDACYRGLGVEQAMRAGGIGFAQLPKRGPSGLMTTTRVLHVTNMYPSRNAVSAGIAVQDTVDALRAQRPWWRHDVFNLRPSARYSGRSGHQVGRLIRYTRAASEYLTRAVNLTHAGARGYDIVHVHYGHTAVASRLARISVDVVTFYGSDVNLRPWRWLSIWAAQRVPEVIVMSSRMRLLLGSRPVTIIPIGIRTEPFAQQRLGNGEARQPSERMRLLFPADPSRPIKDYPLFEAVIECLRRKGLTVDTAVLADIQPEKVPPYFAAADAVLLTSKCEGSPRVAREALSAGCRLVSVDVGDVAELVGSRAGCRVVADRDPETLAEAVEAVVKEPRPSLAMAELGLLDLGETARRVYAVYDRVLDARGRERP